MYFIIELWIKRHMQHSAENSLSLEQKAASVMNFISLFARIQEIQRACVQRCKLKEKMNEFMSFTMKKEKLDHTKKENS